MLVNATEMLQKARDGHYAVGQFNINNLEWTKAALQAAQEMNSPIILGVSEGAGKYMTGFKTVAAMVKAMIDTLGITVPVALHLDHGSYEGAKACVEAGFSSIMFDGSHYAIDENVAKTTELVALAHENGLSIEAEVGSIGGEEDGVVGMGEIADAAECARIASLGIDFLAAGIGNIHGVYPSNWKGLDFDALEKIHNATDHIPLVLHGGTGIPDDMIKKAISLGVSKINVNTECQLAFAKATREYIEAGKDQQGKGFDPRKLLAPGAEAIKNTVKEKWSCSALWARRKRCPQAFSTFQSNGKAPGFPAMGKPGGFFCTPAYLRAAPRQSAKKRRPHTEPPPVPDIRLISSVRRR